MVNTEKENSTSLDAAINAYSLFEERFVSTLDTLKVLNKSEVLKFLAARLQDSVNPLSDPPTDFELGWNSAIVTVASILQLYANEVRNASDKEKCF